MLKRRSKLREDILRSFRGGYGRTSRRRRKYNRDVERMVKKMDPEELDAILRGEDDPGED